MKHKRTNVRNFCIVAHIDHGKSTLADRLIEYTGTVQKRDMENQLLDSMDLERERGITIKLTPTTMHYNYEGEDYILNLIDTPGHVDFTYEVSRSLAACEGALLIVDASQGVEAQTVANAYLAIDNNLEIVPVINKIDLPSARPEAAKKELEDIIGIPSDEAPLVSAKEGINIDKVLEQIIKNIPAPVVDNDAPLKALIFDSYYDNYKGAICMVRIMDGTVKAGTKIYMMGTKNSFEVTEVGTFTPNCTPTNLLQAGDVGYIAASIKTVCDCKVGDTITELNNMALEPLPGYKQIQPVVFSGIFLVDGSKYNDLKDALEKLKLNDASLVYTPEVSAALGYGFRCGFLGLLHLEIITERLEREYGLEIITTAPGVNYKVETVRGEHLEISNPCNMPPVQDIIKWEEPIVKLEVFTPPEYVGAVMTLCQDKRGEYKDMQYMDASRVRMTYIIPLNEIVFDFFDSLKSNTRGYASLDYEMYGYAESQLVRMDILLNGEICDALSLIVHKDKAYGQGKAICEKLKEIIPRQLFEVPIQACIGGKVIARETVKAYRKDVLAKCYGGDVTRKRKLLEKQKEGKKRMRKFGSVELPAEAFISVLKL